MNPRAFSPSCVDFLNNRYMDPQVGVFLSVDPLVGTTGTPYLYANGTPATLSDPSGLIGTATVCTGVDGIGCVNKTTARGFTAWTQTPNGDVISAVAHWQDWKPIDYTDEWVKANGNATEKSIQSHIEKCGGRSGSDWECGELAVLLAGGSIQQATEYGDDVCSAQPDMCPTGGAEAAGVVDWVIEHRGVLATVAASVGCIAPGVGQLSCAGMQSAALGLRTQQRGWSHYEDNLLDAGITAFAIGLGAVFSGEAAVTNAGGATTLATQGFTKGQEQALQLLGFGITDLLIDSACFANHASRTGC